MSILSEIIEWSCQQDEWKQDLIRRLLLQGEYTERDVEEIAEIIKFKHGYMEKQGVAPIGIDEVKVRSVEQSKGNNVVLQKIEYPTNVNNLSRNGMLQFALNGLTVIYGENGSGKTGYSRILKKCCKAREVDLILQNVFKDFTTVKGKATVYYSVNGENRVAEWEDGSDVDEQLSQVVVYDSKCGKIQVTDRNELIYLPGGTDIFKKVIDCIAEIKVKLETLKPVEVVLDTQGIHQESNVIKFIQEISTTTSPEDIDENFNWTEKDEKSLIELSKKVAEANETEIDRKVKRLGVQIQSLVENIKDLYSLEATLCEEEKESLETIVREKEETKKALDIIARKMDAENSLPGTGSELWRLMYNAAKEFSTKSAYPGQNFPYIDGNCIFCQQALSDEARQRLDTFEKFIEEKATVHHEELVQRIEASKKLIEGLQPKIDSILKSMTGDFECLDDYELADITSHVEKLQAVKNAFIVLIENESLDEIDPGFPDIHKSTFLEQKLAITKIKCEEIKKTLNPEVLKILKREKADLEAKKCASSKSSELKRYLEFLKKDEKYRAMMRELDHGPISRIGTSIVTNALRDTFLKAVSTELTKLGGDRIPLFVDSSTRGGSPTFQLSLRGTNLPRRTKIDSILSEGEQKIASLAGLLAELDTAKHQGAIILDDPITSLDHQFRRRIADRLVQEAKTRQVIIFTHDIAFLFDLQQCAAELQIPTHVQSIRKDGDDSGVTFNQNPWHAQCVKDRVKTIRNDIDRLKSANLSGEAYNTDAGKIYGRLRETWERVVEEVLFNGVVTRFGQSIQTQRLNGVVVEDEDFCTIYNEMSRCSKYMIGHDKSLALSDSRPLVEDIYIDLKKLSDFSRAIGTKRELLIKSRKAKVERPPAPELID